MDITKQPEVDYDDSGDGSLTIRWAADDRKSSFSLVIHDGSLIGVHSTLEPPRGKAPWNVKLPKGLVKIDCSALDRANT